MGCQPIHAIDAAAQTTQRRARLVEALFAEIERAAIMRLHHKHAQNTRVALLKHVAQQKEVAQALGHLL